MISVLFTGWYSGYGEKSMNLSRRSFIINASAASTALTAGCLSGDGKGVFRAEGQMRSVLLHLGHNMWGEAQKKMGLDERCFKKAVAHIAKAGLNTLVLDIGEGMRYESHPELAIEGSWSAEKIHDFIRQTNAMGIEVIPKLNFSACHDLWLGEYHRMVSTRRYYEVISDIIRETAEVFGRPRFFHLGFDEETYHHQRKYDVAIIRNSDLWWHDFLFTVGCAEKAGCRAWVWSDYAWKNREFLEKCPKSVLQSNWYYDDDCAGFDVAKIPESKRGYRPMAALFEDLEKAGFDQVPCGSNWVSGYRRKRNLNADGVIGELVSHCRKVVSPERLKGFLMTSWNYITDEKSCAFACRGMDLLSEALKS